MTMPPPAMPRRPAGRDPDAGLRPLRERARETVAGRGRARDLNPPVAPAVLVSVIDGGHIPTGPLAVYLGEPVEIDGEDGEADAASFLADPGAPLPVVVIGRAAVAGDLLVAFAVGGRLVAEHDGPPVGPAATICVRSCQDPSATNFQGASPVAGVTVTLIDAAGKTAGTCRTGPTGCCQIRGLPAGFHPYTLRIADADGHVIDTATGVNLATGSSFTRVLSCCARVCVTVCSPGAIARCPVTVTVKGRDGGTIFSGPTDASGCVYLSLSDDRANFGTYRAYLSNLPPGWNADPTGYPIGCGTGAGEPFPQGSQNSLSPGNGTAFDATCCGNGQLVPIHITLSDANGDHDFVGVEQFGQINWSCTYSTGAFPTIAVPPPVVPGKPCALNQTAPIAILYTGSCAPGLGPYTFNVTRSWAAQDFSGAKQYIGGNCGAGTGNPHPCGGFNGDCATGSAVLGDACEAFGIAMAMTPSPNNFLPDPVGGGIALS